MKISSVIWNAFKPRKEFHINKSIQWFPGHMHKGLNEIGRRLKRTDCVLEIHDARIPFSGRNLNLIKRLCHNKPIILILNKADLVDTEWRNRIEKKLVQEMRSSDIHLHDIFFMKSLENNRNSSKLDQKFLSSIIDCIKERRSTDQSDILKTTEGYNLLVLGIPNKPGKATIVGPTAGVTKAVLERIKICDYPEKIYLFDSPGILEPGFQITKLSDRTQCETFMRCALCGTIADRVVGMELIADYLLFWMNQNSIDDYLDFFGLQKPTDNIVEALTYGAIKNNNFRSFYNIDKGQTEKVPNLEQMAESFVLNFRKGNLSTIPLDKNLIENS
ncbi:Mitochondrial GTPase 1 [Sarcoptes scabiei]|uniref:Mitochondrial GTPase 1 n=1 Tax=Sarcoptes scabiei TaxID=52283 RepID=A0A834RJ51_SARSC|nr:Mitochondrial GTPase 1 [Sarcoptes scabiei]